MSQPKKKKVALFLITSMHLAGVIGLAVPFTRELFKYLTPFNLVVSLTFIFLFHENKEFRFYLLAFIICTLSFLVEYMGVSTGRPFGAYFYEGTLGAKIFEVPLLIGVNWLVLVYCFSYVFQDVFRNRWLRSLVVAVSMTMLDIIIEPVAIYFDFWQWIEVEPPVENYISWFAVAFILSLLFNKLCVIKRNEIAVWLLSAQIFFFLSLYILLNILV